MEVLNVAVNNIELEGKVKLRILRALLAMSMAAPGLAFAGFPEIPFCPLGGPPGWFNTLFDSDHKRWRYPPPYYRYPPNYPAPPVAYQVYPPPAYPAPVPVAPWQR